MADWTDDQVRSYIDSHPGIGRGDNKYGAEDMARARSAMGAAPATPAQQVGATNAAAATQVVAGNAQAPNQMNVADYAGQVAANPSLIVKGDASLVEQNKENKMTGTEAGTNINSQDPKYAMDNDKLEQTAAQAQTEQASQVDPRETNTYDVKTTQEDVANADMEAAQGEVSEGAEITDEEVPQIDVKGIAEGTDANGVGQALADYAFQDLDQVDQKATVKGQLDLLQADFVDADGNPKIPGWAQGTAKAVGRVTAFTGRSGSAATAAMAAALMEASLPIASQDAQFFQTLTLQNLNNKQASIINKANVLSKMEMDNADARLTAAIENSKNFMAMDLANLNNEQQAAVINNQNRVQSILEDAKQENAKRLFTADSQNEMDKFYDQLNSNIDMYNTSQSNAMNQYNTSQTNDMSKFNAEMENNREQFYKAMQFQIDTANAKWRQTVTLQEDTQAFEAAATDVKNMIGISTEQLNQLWDRSDALLDYAWKSTENQLNRNAEVALAKMNNKAKQKAADQEGFGQLIGTVGSQLLGGLFG